MTAEEVVAYLRTWAKLNAQEVYGSPRDYINIDKLNNVLDEISESRRY